jgi:hypothetical protein
VAVERGGSRRAVPAPVSVVAADTETPGAEAAAVDEAWDMLGDLAGEFDVETLGDSLGSSLSAGADSVVWQLDDNERAELTRLLRAELQPHGSGS